MRTFSLRCNVFWVVLSLMSLWPAILRVEAQAPPGVLEERDVQIVKQRLRESVLPSDPKAIEKVHNDAATLRAAMSADGSWPNIDYADKTRGPWKVSAHLDRLLTLAKAYRTNANNAAQQAELKAPMMLAL